MFRLTSLSLLHHRVLGNVHLNFCQENGDFGQGIYTSVIIGANGIGKSFLLRAIADIFSYLDMLKRGINLKKNPVEFNFTIKYRLGAADYEFSNIPRVEPQEKRGKRNYSHVIYKRNGETAKAGQMVVPQRIIASTMTVTDKFTTVNTGNYIYKGIRNENSPGTTGTRTMIRKTVSGLLHSLDVKEGFRQELMELLEHMGLRPRLEVGYVPEGQGSGIGLN